MMKIIITIFAILSGFLLWGCHPKGAEFAEDTDVVVTTNNPTYDFSAKSTYGMPDKIAKITGNLQTGDVPEFMLNEYATKILARIESNMSALGYKRVALDSNPDLILATGSLEKTSTYSEYWIFWMGSYNPYLGIPVKEEYSYTTETLLMILYDPKITDEKGYPVKQWVGGINGLLKGTYSDTRVNKSIDQAFAQSLYLTTN